MQKTKRLIERFEKIAVINKDIIASNDEIIDMAMHVGDISGDLSKTAKLLAFLQIGNRRSIEQ